LRRLAMLNHETACKTADALADIDGVDVITNAYFNEFTLRLAKKADEVVEALAQKGILAGVPGNRLWQDTPEADNLLIVAATECVTDDDINTLADGLRHVL